MPMTLTKKSRLCSGFGVSSSRRARWARSNERIVDFTTLLFLCGSRRAEDVAHRVIAFVTRVLEDLLRVTDLGQRHDVGPRPCPGIRVLEGHTPLDDGWRDRREALGHHDVLGGALRRRFGSEVGRLDNQGVAFPPAARIAKILARAFRTSASFQRNDASLVNHFVTDDHRIRTLRDVVAAAVTGWHHRVGNTARDAAIVEAHVEPTVERTARVGVGADAASAAPRGRVGTARNAAVRRIDDEPGAAVLAIEGVEDEMRG